MVDLQEIYAFICGLAPLELAEDWDNPGLLVHCDTPVNRVLVSLDITDSVAREARERECQLVVSHHPVIFHGMKQLNSSDPACKLMRDGISAICMHTNLDAAQGGVNDTLANCVGLTDTLPIAGGMGRMGEIPETMPRDLAGQIAKSLNAHVKWADAGKPIHRLALVSGGGGSLLQEAIDAGADALLTGEANHHAAIDALHAGVSLFVAGHYATEKPVAAVLVQRLSEQFPQLEVLVSETEQDPFCFL